MIEQHVCFAHCAVMQSNPPLPHSVSRRGVLFVALPAAGLFAASLLRSGRGDARLPNATWTFYSAGGQALAPTYGDAGLSAQLTNPVKADRAGNFPPVFLDSDREYRAVLESADGQVLRNVERVQIPAPQPYDVFYHGADPSGRLSSQAAFDRARAATGGRYHIPGGVYLLDDVGDPLGSNDNIWADVFTSDPGVTLKVGWKSYDVSNCLMGAAFQVERANSRYRIIRNARTGKDLFRLSERDLESGDAHTTYYPWNTIFDGHGEIYEPRTPTGAVDLLFRKAFGDLDPNRNDFSLAYEPDGERWSLNFATTVSGGPKYDGAIHLYGGGAPGGARLEFPALAPRFSQGFRVTTRTDGNFKLDSVPSGDGVHFSDADTKAVHVTFGRGGRLGFFGIAPTGRPVVSGSIANGSALRSLLRAMAALGMIDDQTRS